MGETMTTEASAGSSAREPELLGQTVVLIGGSAGIGLETARRARSEGADVVLTGRDPGRLERAASDVDARSTAAFDATEQFFDGLPDPIDHVLITGPSPITYPCSRWTQLTCATRSATTWCWGSRSRATARGKMRAGGTLLLMAAPAAGRSVATLGIVSAATAVLPPFTAALALTLAPVRVNLIAAGFVDTPLSASLLGDGLEARREELRTTVPIGRVVGPADVAALAVHIMTNTALTGATYDIDGGQQFVA
jgi:NAD(P)-dependent dehydrogenase (short-subunit alcohol dehydrogenase family)